MNTEIENLIPGKRYTFYYNQSKYPHIQYRSFRATFLDVYNKNTLRVFSYSNNSNIMDEHNSMRTMPLEWVLTTESLEDIIKEQTVLPEEILLEIDSFY